jgi:LuxR family transcriptional regulator, maltose regulon positive regulatory protein
LRRLARIRLIRPRGQAHAGSAPGEASGSEPILLDIEDANAFVESLDPGGGWFRYHRLLADFLRLELRRTLPAEVPVPHRRAAEWFLEQG